MKGHLNCHEVNLALGQLTESVFGKGYESVHFNIAPTPLKNAKVAKITNSIFFSSEVEFGPWPNDTRRENTRSDNWHIHIILLYLIMK